MRVKILAGIPEAQELGECCKIPPYTFAMAVFTCI
jgi:hypothetical protein